MIWHKKQKEIKKAAAATKVKAQTPPQPTETHPPPNNDNNITLTALSTENKKVVVPSSLTVHVAGNQKTEEVCLLSSTNLVIIKMFYKSKIHPP